MREGTLGSEFARRSSIAALVGAALVVTLATPSRAAAAVQDASDDEFRPRAFQLYDTPAARARAKEASEHVRAGRWSEALTELQALIEEHRGEVLAADRPLAEGARYPSQSDVHSGAGSWAVQRLFALPEEGRALYRDRFGRRAEAALQRSIAASDRGGLARVAQRWPLTTAAEKAWWSLGDLEVELGHAGDGLRAWARAAALRLGEPERVTVSPEHWRELRVALQAADAPAPGALARIDLALELLPTLDEDESGRPRSEASFAAGPARGIAAASITSTQFDDDGIAGWPKPFRLPNGPFHDSDFPHRLFPQRAGDFVLVNTSRSVHALDAFDGNEVWRLDDSQLGWSRTRKRRSNDFDDAVDKVERIVTVAASRGVVVAAVQIPFSFEDSDKYNDLSIIEVIPERRLVALDLETGDPLWNTMPPAEWDGDSGSFSQRMTVVGPPTVVGARVLVPVARLRGRIEMHLGCFDLGSGDVLWSAPLVTGQRTLNMFGRADREFSAPPPVVSGDTVVVGTQLGLVAAVDLFTGETRWNTLYDQVPIQPPQYYSTGYMHSRWRNAPPAVVDDTIVFAPYDGKELFALDVATGAMLWQVDWREVNRLADIGSSAPRSRKAHGLNVLIGADERRLILGGSTIASIDFAEGLRHGPPFQRAWAWPLDASIPHYAGYPVLDSKSVFAQTEDGVTVLDRETGAERERVSIGRGQLLVADGMLFSANGLAVDARFEWIAMVERARLAVRSPDATSSDLDMLVRLLLERAETQLDRGTDVDRALALTEEAERAIEGFEADADDVPVGVGSDAARRKLQRHRSLMLRTRGERLSGRIEAARAAALRAIEFDVSRPKTLEARLALHEIERSQDPRARMEILETLLLTHSDSEIEVEARARLGDWSARRALALVLGSVNGAGGASGSRAIRDTLWSDPWEGSIVPTSAAISTRSSDRGRRTTASSRMELERTTMSVALFARLQQIEMARSSVAADDAIARELDALHQILLEAGDEPLFGAGSGEWASARIRALRALHPNTQALATIDSEAAELLDRARDAAETTGSTVLLERLPALYPGSPAARDAAESRIEYALTNGSPQDVAAIVVETLSRDWHPGRSSERDTALLVRLAATLGAAGNDRLRAGVIANLARYRPDEIVDVPTLGALRLDDLRDRWAVPPAPRPATLGTFDTKIVTARAIEGSFMPVGRARIGLQGSEQDIALAASEDLLVALAPGRQGEPLWTRPTVLGVNLLDRWERVTAVDDGILVAEKHQVACLDPESGEARWSFSRRDRHIARIVASDGVVVVVTERADGTQEPAEVHGIDALLGIPLWSLGSIAGTYHSYLKVGDGRLALLPKKGRRLEDTAVHDLFTGHPLTAVATGSLDTREAQVAWVDRGRLVLAFIDGGRVRNARNEIVAFELDDGKVAWQVDLTHHAGSVHSLAGVIEMPSDTSDTGHVRLALLESIEGTGARMGTFEGPALALHVLDERLGALDRRPLVTLDAKTQLVGVKERQRVVLDSPILISVGEPRDGERPLLQGIDPRRGVLWKQMSARNIVTGSAKRRSPAVVGDGVIALMVNELFGRPQSPSAETKLLFLDDATGRQVEMRPLESGFASAHWRSLVGFGGSLAIMGEERMEVLE